MASISIVDLFVALENHVGKDALLCAFAAYSGALSTPAKAAVAVPPVPGAPVKVRKPQSEEVKAAAALKRAATKAAKAIAAAAPEAVVAEPVPAAAPAAAEEKPKKVLSEEQKAKMAAGRAAAAAKKAAAAAAAPSAAVAVAEPVAVAVPAPEADGNASDTSSQKRRGPKKLSEMSPEERVAHDKKVAERKAAKAAKAAAPAAAAVPLPASPAPVAADENGPTVFAPFTHKGVSYLRNMRGDLLTQEYEWVGRYNSAAKTIDTKFAKPADLEDE